MTAKEYPGNSSLSAETKRRVIETFDQALSLYDEARMDEVVAGCDLILQMDGRFEPASRLREKAQNPSAAIDLSDLAQYRQLQIGEGSDDPADTEQLLTKAREAMSGGDYQTAVDACNEILASDANNVEAREIGTQAHEALESAPFISQYIQEADAAIGRGDSAAAQTAIDKAKSLNDKHPDIAAAESRLLSMSPSAPTPTSSPGGEEETSEGFDFGTDESGFASAFTSESEASPSAPVESPEPGFTPDEGSEASSFGFTLEDSPEEQEPAETAQQEQQEGESTQAFDFSVGEVSVSEDDQENIETYLQEGDQFFEAGEYTKAIDSWSKIFLIDVTNEEANVRIEKAKEKKRENESKLDELVGTGIAAYDRGDYTTAQQTFEEVLAGDPDNFKAQEYLEKLRDHQAATGAAAATPPPPPAGDMYGDPGDVYEGPPIEGDVYQGPPPDGVPPPPTQTSQRPAPAAAAADSSSKLRPLIVVLLTIMVVGAGGYLLYSMFFADDTPDVVAPTGAETQGKITRARIAAEQERFDEAIRLLTTIPASDPLHSEAVQLLADVRQRQQTALAADNRELFDGLVEQGRLAMEAEDFGAAVAAFEQAEQIQQLEPSDQQALTTARREMRELQAATSLLEQGNYAEAIANLEPILEREPDNLGARRLAGFAWYNRGVRSLRDDNDMAGAARYFRESLTYIPDDEMAQRNLDFIEKYSEQSPDLLYRIYIKYLEYK